MRQGLIYELTDKDLFLRRSGYADLQIGLSEIAALHERPGWLVVLSAEPRRTIAIPQQVEGFRFLRAELTKHSHVITLPRLSLLRRISRLIPLVAYL